jgi:hypothetical protein
MFGSEVQDTTDYRKGLKLRTDSTTNGVALSSIMDLGTGRMIMLWHDSKTAHVVETKASSHAIAKGHSPEFRQSITPTSQSRQIAGSTCIVHHVTAAFAIPKMEMVPAMTIVMQGTTCLVKDGPGQADFTAFYQALAESAFVPVPARADEQLAATKASAAMYREMASLGVPFATEVTIGVEGEGLQAEVMKDMGNTYTTEVSSVSTDPIPDSMFEIPPEYKVVKR